MKHLAWFFTLRDTILHWFFTISGKTDTEALVLPLKQVDALLALPFAFLLGQLWLGKKFQLFAKSLPNSPPPIQNSKENKNNPKAL